MLETELKFIKSHLDDYGNCGCGRKILKKYGTENVLEELRKEGYDCILEIVPDNGKTLKNIKYPLDATYILSLISSKKGNICKIV